MVKVRIKTSKRQELREITVQVAEAVASSGLQEGLVHIYVPHTTAGVLINENADPSVRADIEALLSRIVPYDFPYTHLEGNGAAHVKSSLVGSGVFVPFEDGKLCLGRWQGIFFCEFDGPRSREVWLTFITAAKT